MDISNILNQNNLTIILAVANIRHKHFGHNNNDENGKILYNFMTHSDLYYLCPNFKTFYKNNRKSKQDILISNFKFLTHSYFIIEG